VIAEHAVEISQNSHFLKELLTELFLSGSMAAGRSNKGILLARNHKTDRLLTFVIQSQQKSNVTAYHNRIYANVCAYQVTTYILVHILNKRAVASKLKIFANEIVLQQQGKKAKT
jgi:hypothetical protein